MIGITTSVYMEVMNGLGQDVYRLTIPDVQHVLMVRIVLILHNVSLLMGGM